MRNPNATMFSAAVLCAILTLPVRAETPLEAALADGQQLTADEISDRIVDHTVTARAGERTFQFYYAPDNILTGRLVGGEWRDTGYYGISDGDQVCLSMSSDEGRLRCMHLIARDGIVQKFNAAGDMTFELLSFEPGNRL